jgi:hypothetical protein
MYWSDRNHHVALDDHRLSNMWCPIRGSALVHNRLTGGRYGHLPETKLQPYFDAVVLYFYQDGAPLPFSCAMRQWLDQWTVNGS